MGGIASTRPAAFLDWDNSLSPGFSLQGVMDLVGETDPRWAEASRILRFTQRQWVPDRYDDFAVLAEALFVYLMDGQSVDGFARVVDEFVRRNPPRPGAGELIGAVLSTDCRAVIVSGAPIEVIRRQLMAIEPNLDATANLAARVETVGWELERGDTAYFGRLASGNTARARVKESLVKSLRGAGPVRLGLGDSIADEPLMEGADIQAWVQPAAQSEAGRVKWSGRRGSAGVGSLSDLAAFVRTSSAAVG